MSDTLKKWILCQEKYLHYCSTISKDLIKRLVTFLKMHTEKRKRVACTIMSTINCDLHVL